jgi:hypothetical protein
MQKLFSRLTLGSAVAAQLLLFVPAAQAAVIDIHNTSFPGGTIGNSYHAVLYLGYNGTAPSVNVTFTNLPPGLSPTSITGVSTYGGGAQVDITGTPTMAGTFPVTITVTDQNGATASGTYEFGIAAILGSANLQILTQNLDDAIIGQPYSYQLQVSGGTAPYNWSPVSTTYPSACCILGINQEGTFTTQTSSSVEGPAGNYSWVIQVTDSRGFTATKTVYLNILNSSNPNPTSPPAVSYYSYPPRNVVFNGTVYLVNNINRQPYTSAGAFLSYSFNKWIDVVPATSADLSLPLSSYTLPGSSSPVIFYVQPRNGSLINDHGTVFIITNGQRQGFSSAKVFIDLGYSFANVIPGDTSFMTTISPINNTQQSHPAGSVINDRGTLYYMQSNGSRVGIPSMEIFYSWGLKLNEVVKANYYDKVTPTGSALQYRMTNQFGL